MDGLASFQMILSSEFSRTKFLLMINHLREPRKLHTAKISSYTVLFNQSYKVQITPLVFVASGAYTHMHTYPYKRNRVHTGLHLV